MRGAILAFALLCVAGRIHPDEGATSPTAQRPVWLQVNWGGAAYYGSAQGSGKTDRLRVWVEIENRSTVRVCINPRSFTLVQGESRISGRAALGSSPLGAPSVDAGETIRGFIQFDLGAGGFPHGRIVFEPGESHIIEVRYGTAGPPNDVLPKDARIFAASGGQTVRMIWRMQDSLLLDADRTVEREGRACERLAIAVAVFNSSDGPWPVTPGDFRLHVGSGSYSPEILPEFDRPLQPGSLEAQRFRSGALIFVVPECADLHDLENATLECLTVDPSERASRACVRVADEPLEPYWNDGREEGLALLHNSSAWDHSGSCLFPEPLPRVPAGK